MPSAADREFALFNLLENGQALGSALENASFESYQSVGPNAAALIAQGDLRGLWKAANTANTTTIGIINKANEASNRFIFKPEIFISYASSILKLTCYK